MQFFPYKLLTFYSGNYCNCCFTDVRNQYSCRTVCEVNQQSLYRCCRCCLLGGVRVGGGKTYNCIHHSFKGFYVSATISCLKVSTFKPTSLDVLKSASE